MTVCIQFESIIWSCVVFLRIYIRMLYNSYTYSNENALLKRVMYEGFENTKSKLLNCFLSHGLNQKYYIWIFKVDPMYNLLTI